MEEIKTLIQHILFLTVVIIVSLIVWPKDIKVYNSAQGVRYLFAGFDEVEILSNDEYELAKPKEFYLKNVGSNKSDCSLYFKYSKYSTLDYKNIKVSLDNNIYNLNELYSYQDDEYYYFRLNNYSLDSYETDVISARVWTDSSEGYLLSTIVAM